MDINLREEIAKAAYSLYEERGMLHGHDLDDWLLAESIVSEHSSKKQNKNGSPSIRRKKSSKRNNGIED